MSDLRNRLIKFAYNHPQYRKDILPLVKSGGTDKAASLKKFQKKCNIYYRKHLTINFVGVTGEGSAEAKEISEGCQAFELEVMKVFSRLGINMGKDECMVNANRGFTFAMTKVFDGKQVQDLLTSAFIRNRADDGDLGSIDDLVKLLESQGWACTVR